MFDDSGSHLCSMLYRSYLMTEKKRLASADEETREEVARKGGES